MHGLRGVRTRVPGGSGCAGNAAADGREKVYPLSCVRARLSRPCA